MNFKPAVKSAMWTARSLILPWWLLLKNPSKERFACPVCRYAGPFADFPGRNGFRKHSRCPRCNCAERHRLQILVLREVQKQYDLSKMRMLHFAPEVFFKPVFKAAVKTYTTADLNGQGVDIAADLTKLPFEAESFDFIFASHVLEHVMDDLTALAEISRVLTPGGIAILPVPIVQRETVDYGKPNPREDGHVRACGEDYFDRYKPFFSEVKVFRSSDFPGKHQAFVYEDRTCYPTQACPRRQPSVGDKHEDFVPVCRK